MKDEDDLQFSFRELLSTLVPAGVLSWALAMLTASYMGYAKIDAAFISSLVTSVLAVYGIHNSSTVKRGGNVGSIRVSGIDHDPSKDISLLMGRTSSVSHDDIKPFGSSRQAAEPSTESNASHAETSVDPVSVSAS